MIDSLLRRLTRAGFRRAMGGDHWAWFAVAGAAYLLRRARRPDHEVARLDLAALEPGQGYEVRLVGPGRGSGGRGARRRAGTGVGAGADAG